LVPDKPFFLALRNRFINTTNVYLLRVDSDATCSAPPPPPLLAGQSVRSVASAASAGEATEGDTFEVNVASGAQSVSFHVEAEGDAMIVAQKGAIPTRDTYSHAQNAPGSGSETLSIGAASGLSAGVWYVRVLNNTEEPFEYTITAQGDIAAPAPRTELIAEQSNGAIRLLWNSTAGVSYRIESSSDLENWSTVTTVTASGGTAEYSDPINGVSRRFYRVARLN
jgi:hypothetical protein